MKTRACVSIFVVAIVLANCGSRLAIVDGVATCNAAGATGDPVVVPDVCGMAQAEAEGAIRNALLFLGTVSHGYSASVPAGNIISQEPAGGSVVEKHSAVNVVVSLGSLAIPPRPNVGGSLRSWGARTLLDTDLVDIAAIATGMGQSLVLRKNGSIAGWGNNYDGQAMAPDGNDFVAIAGGGDHSLALKADGSIVGWGYNGYGQATAPAGNDFAAIAAGRWHSLALKSDGSMVGWGYNEYGQATVPVGNDFVAIAAGAYHGFALKADGSIVGWGQDYFGQATAPGGNDFVAIAAGGSHGLAIKNDGSVVGWGYNEDGQAEGLLGDFVAIAGGSYTSLALKSDGSITGLGYDYSDRPPAGNDFVAIAAGSYHDLALKSNGSIVGWGENNHGQATPPAGNGFVAIAGGLNYSLAIIREPVFEIGFNLLNGERVRQAVFEYECGVTVKNVSEDTLSLSGVELVGWPGNVEVVDPCVSISGVLEPGETAVSTDTCTIRVDRSQLIAEDQIEWRATYQIAESGMAMEETAKTSIGFLFVRGDVTGEGVVDMSDLAELARQWLGEPGEPSADIAPGGGDGQVDMIDFAELSGNWLAE